MLSSINIFYDSVDIVTAFNSLLNFQVVILECSSSIEEKFGLIVIRRKDQIIHCTFVYVILSLLMKLLWFNALFQSNDSVCWYLVRES